MDAKKKQSPNAKDFVVSASNVPKEFFANREEAKKYFRAFGKVKLLTFRPKRQMLLVEYTNEESMQNAVEIAGEYKGQLFQVQRYAPTPKKKKSKHLLDPDWIEDAEVRSELEAMRGTRLPPRTFDLRSDAMQVDSQDSPSKSDLSTPKSAKKSNWRNTSSPKPKTKKASQQKSDLITLIKSQAHTIEDKYRILDARDKLIRLRLKESELDKVGATVGTCRDMCPEKERLMREVQHQVHIYEQEEIGRGMNPRLAVKQYSRSSADQEAALPQDLRPVAVLQMTMGYLMHKIMDLCDQPEVNMAEWYHFLWDRTRGIRKDITQQELCCQGSVELVEQCARFHIFCSARLVSEDPSVFDQKINTENLTKCLQTLKYMYHDLLLKGESCRNEPEFRAYIILLNLNDGNFMWEVQQLKAEIQHSYPVKFAMEVYSSLDKQNYVKFFKLVNSTTFLNACILMRYFVQVRMAALKTLLKCYSPRLVQSQSTLPIAYLTRILAFENDRATVEFLETFGLQIDAESNRVVLKKHTFQPPDYPYVLERAVNLVETKRAFTVGEIVCGRDLPPKLYESHVPQNSFDQRGFFKITADLIDEECEEVHVETAKVQDEATIFTASKQTNTFQNNVNASTNIFATFTTTPTCNNGTLWPKTNSIFGATPITLQSTAVDATELPEKPAEIEENVPEFDEEIERQRLIEEMQQKQRAELELKRQRDEQQRKMRLLEEAAAAKARLQHLEMEKKRLQQLQKVLEEKEREKQRLARLEEARKLEEANQRKREEENRRKVEEENQRKQREAEEVRLREIQRKKDVNHVLVNLLDAVEESVKNDRLARIKCSIERRKLLKYYGKWREIARKKRKRKAMDFEPFWVGTRTLREEARELVNFDDCLAVIKRYKYEKPIEIDPDNIRIVKRIKLIPLVEKTLLNRSREMENKLLSEIYWKVAISLPDKREFPRGLNHLEGTLDTLFNWDQNRTILLEQSKNHPVLTCCVEKQKSGAQNRGDSNGLIFFGDAYNDHSKQRLVSHLKNYGSLVKIPIVFILQSNDKSDSLDLAKKDTVSDYTILVDKLRPENVHVLVEKALVYLAGKAPKMPPLQLDTLRNFLTKYACSDIWRKANSLAKWNSNYKTCLKKPQLVIQLHNEAIDRVKSVVLDESWREQPKFPEVFRECLASEIPEYLPCDYRFFPKGLTTKYFLHLESLLDGLYLENLHEKWPPRDESALETLIKKYCNKMFRNPERVFLKVMGVLLKNCDPNVNFESIADVLWTEVVEVLALEKLEQTDFALRPCLRVEQSIFNQLIVIYDVNQVSERLSCDWFYMNCKRIKKEVEKLLQVATPVEHQAVAVTEDKYDIDIDAMLQKLMETPRKRNIDSTAEGDVKRCKHLLDDLEDSLIVNKRILETSGNILEKIIIN